MNWWWKRNRVIRDDREIDPNKTYKIVFKVDGRKLIELNQLANRVDCDKRDLFNGAFDLLEWAIEETEKGREIATIDESEYSYRTFRMPIFTKIRKGPQPPRPSGPLRRIK
jgi:hypothetical protein